MGGPGSGRKPYTNAVCGTRRKYDYHWRRGENCQICKNAVAAIAKANYVPKPRKDRQPPSVRKQDRKDWMIAQKVLRNSCIDCGLKITAQTTYMFDFDHRDPHLKSFTISLKLHSRTEFALLQEMDKCDLVCANCHRHRTNHQQKTGILTGYKKDRLQQQTLTCHDSVPTLF